MKGGLAIPPLSYDAKHLILLSRHSLISKLIVIHRHNLVQQNSVKQSLNQVGTQFWIPKARKFIRRIIHKCLSCRYYEGKPYLYPFPPELPASRLDDDFPTKHIIVLNMLDRY